MTIPPEITTIVFDWGDTLMFVDPRFEGPMAAWPDVKAMPGIHEGLAALDGRFKLAIASNAVDSSTAEVRAALGRVGLAEYFGDIFTTARLGTKKPDPAYFQRAAQALGAAPHELVMVGDSFTVDVVGARRAGWRAVWYNPSGKAAPGSVPWQDGELADLAGLAEALGRLDLPDALTCQAWYLEHGTAGTLWQHVEAVGLAAYQMAVWLRAAGEQVDPLLAQRGGLLHDVAKLAAKRGPNFNHGELGAEILRQKGQPALAEIARRHMLFYLLDPVKAPRTWEEKIVHYADKICEGPRFVEWQERLEGLAERYPEQIEAMRGCTAQVMSLQGEIAAAAGVPAEELVARVRRAVNS